MGEALLIFKASPAQANFFPTLRSTLPVELAQWPVKVGGTSFPPLFRQPHNVAFGQSAPFISEPQRYASWGCRCFFFSTKSRSPRQRPVDRFRCACRIAARSNLLWSPKKRPGRGLSSSAIVSGARGVYFVGFWLVAWRVSCSLFSPTLGCG